MQQLPMQQGAYAPSRLGGSLQQGDWQLPHSGNMHMPLEPRSMPLSMGTIKLGMQAAHVHGDSMEQSLLQLPQQHGSYAAASTATGAAPSSSAYPSQHHSFGYPMQQAAGSYPASGSDCHPAGNGNRQSFGSHQQGPQFGAANIATANPGRATADADLLMPWDDGCMAPATVSDAVAGLSMGSIAGPNCRHASDASHALLLALPGHSGQPHAAVGAAATKSMLPPPRSSISRGSHMPPLSGNSTLGSYGGASGPQYRAHASVQQQRAYAQQHAVHAHAVHAMHHG